MFSFDNKLILAPLAGVSNSVFRKINRENGADIVLSEMVSADGTIRNNKLTIDYLKFTPDERPFGVQLFGSDPAVLGAAAKYIEEYSQPDFIDINFGCPVKKVVKRSAGSALLRNPYLVGKIVKAISSAVKIPVTAKIRSGWSRKSINILEVAKIIEDNGASALTVHPRTQEDGFSGKSDWELIRTVKEIIKIPVIGNGDINSADDAIKMYSQTNCNALMLARGTFGNPWLFNEIKAKIAKTPFIPPTYKEKTNTCIRHLDLMIELFGEKKGVFEMRKHTSWYLKGIQGASVFKKKIFVEENVEIIKELIQEAFLPRPLIS